MSTNNITFANRIASVEEYYFSKKLAEVKALDKPEKPVINLGIGSPDLAPAEPVIESLKISAAKANHHGYQSYKGIPAFRNAIAGFYKSRYNVQLHAETEILPLVGSKEGIMHTCMAFINPGDEVLIPDPGYPTYAAAAKLAGGIVRTYHLKEENDWQIDIEQLEKQDLSNVKIMWINSPHMPTGSVLTHAMMARLIALAKRFQFLLVNDNPYSFILNEQPTSLLALPHAKEVCLELNSLSKSHNMAGWRLGWVAGEKIFIEAILKVKSNMDSGMFLPLQEAAAKALQLPESWHSELNALYAKRKVAASNLLKQLGCTITTPQVGLFVWAKVPHHVNSVEKWIDEILYATHVFITPGFIFGKNGNRFVRVSLCANENLFAQAHERIQQFMLHQTQPV
ncbi:MAG: aminotransferase class I/II-fold pyridoxal phosphate-dependent enzyme [Cyclobacteriaceae bacterium]|jgi:aspartate/methionine/tyrosine aminotransferase|nr:aminotransferase class I/II-fold pyridoxal phosphate-dependent enzyme [Cyclobacteriaceae bacterium]